MQSAQIMNCLLIVSCLWLATATVHGAGLFATRVLRGSIGDPLLEDITGIGVSRAHDNVLYAHQYQVDGNFLYALDINTGALLANFTLTGARNFDWEDMAVGPCVDDCAQTPCTAASPPATYCIYVADIGNHRFAGAANVIYRVREPTVIQDGSLPVVGSLTFSWPEEDAETLMVSPEGRLFITGKVETGRAMVAELPASAWSSNPWGTPVILNISNTGILKIFTTHHDPQGGDISPNGKEVLFVAEEEVFYLNIGNQDYIDAVRTTVPESVSSYITVPSTEAIAWAPDGSGFYTVAKGPKQYIYYYAKTNIDDFVVG